jgi:hypothetical protein
MNVRTSVPVDLATSMQGRGIEPILQLKGCASNQLDDQSLAHVVVANYVSFPDKGTPLLKLAETGFR